MSRSPLQSDWSALSAEPTPIVRDFGNYSLSFPCNPHDLRGTSIGFRLLFWSDFLLVASILVGVVSLYWLLTNSEPFQQFCETITIEKLDGYQQLPFAERQKVLEKELSLGAMELPLSLASLGMLAGLGLNLMGTCFCMSCPKRVIPGAYIYGLIWFGAILISGIIPFLGPLLFLFAWQFWLSYVFRLSVLLGEKNVVTYLRQIHRFVFCTILAFLGVSLSPMLFGENSMGTFMTMVFFISIFIFLIIGFLQYAKVLKTLRIAIRRFTSYWDNGNDDLHVVQKENS